MNKSCSSISTSSSSSSKPLTKYEVFLSFRGEDTRNTFTSHLYAALCQKGIYTFLDNDKLERGKSISPELLKAIEESRCSIIILSKNYASSTWCLDELVKILQCMKDYAQIVLPIFYHVDPSHVRKQIGSFRKAFQRHEQVFSHNLEKVQSWRDALKEVGNLAGWHLHDRDEAKFIQDFIGEVSGKFNVAQLNISKEFVGMNSRLEKLNLCVSTSSSDDVRFIGICGMGGIGKTTLAKAYYELMSSQFKGSSFLANVREVCEKKENGLVHLQNLLLSDILNGEPKEIRDLHKGKDKIRSRLHHKKVLIVLDDLDKLEQLKALAEKDNWFGSGSRIIVTTRDESLLKSTDNKCIIYRVEQLTYSESLQLLSWKTFKSIQPLNEYIELSKQVIDYAKGLPLALEVLGSFLCGKSINEWKSALDRLTEYPKKEIVKVLQITFDGLEETEKSIFLDIACFFNGFDKDYIIRMMDSCGFFPEIGIRVLIDKSLLHIGHDNELWMHDLLQEMGKEIVREKCCNEPGRQSRLWDIDDLCHVFEYKTGTKEVEAIVCSKGSNRKILSWEAFSKMKKLRLLIIGCPWKIMEETKIAHYFSFLAPKVGYLFNELRILAWCKFPLNNFPSSFQLDRLVELSLVQSNIKQLWKNPIKPLYNLKIIDLRHSEKLSKFEDFRVVPNLEKLILQGTALQEVHQSITLLKRLTILDLKQCTSLVNLPTSMSGLESLKILDLLGCSSLFNLPKDLGNLKSLQELNVRHTNIRDLPSSIVLLKNLKTLSCGGRFLGSLQWTDMIKTIVGGGLYSEILYSLKKLVLSNCGLGKGGIPENFGGLVCLEYLDLSSNFFTCLPASMNELSKLKYLDVMHCTNLKTLGPELPLSLEIVRADSCNSLDSFLDPLKQCNLRCSAFCTDCFDLVRRQGSKRTTLAFLKRYLQNPPNPRRRFELVLPGNEIPAWFTHQCLGWSISLQLDPNWCNSKWMGLALCACADTDFCCDIRINEQDWGFGLIKCPTFYSSIHHLWLLYLPCDTYFNMQNSSSSRIEFTFKPEGVKDIEEYMKMFFKACGVRLVYEHDMEDLERSACIEFPDEDVEDLDFF